MEQEDYERYLKNDERIDDLGIAGLKILQSPGRFCFGMDAVLLTEFIKHYENKSNEKSKVFDLGTGTGIIPILLHAKINTSHITGIDIQDESADMAKRSIQMNGLNDDIEIVCDDIKNVKNNFESGAYDIVSSNPPYTKRGSGIVNPNDSFAVARHEIFCDFNDVCEAASHLLKNKGRFYLVHRPNRLCELFETMKKNKLEPKYMRTVHSFENTEATMVLICAIKNASSQMIVEKPLIIYKDKDNYTDEVKAIYQSK